jgi:hypothetical protein
MEFARDRDGVMPRVFGVNHHPEILDRRHQLGLLEAKRAAGEVSQEWVQERVEILTRTYEGEDSERRLQETSEATLLGPMRFLLDRQLWQRAEQLGRAPGVPPPAAPLGPVSLLP